MANEEANLDVMIRTGISDPIAVGLAETLLQEAGIPYFRMDENVAVRQRGGNILGWWDVRVPKQREAEAREILLGVEEMR